MLGHLFERKENVGFIERHKVGLRKVSVGQQGVLYSSLKSQKSFLIQTDIVIKEKRRLKTCHWVPIGVTGPPDIL
jgi:hypothetical protein